MWQKVAKFKAAEYFCKALEMMFTDAQVHVNTITQQQQPSMTEKCQRHRDPTQPSLSRIIIECIAHPLQTPTRTCMFDVSRYTA